MDKTRKKAVSMSSSSFKDDSRGEKITEITLITSRGEAIKVLFYGLQSLRPAREGHEFLKRPLLNGALSSIDLSGRSSDRVLRDFEASCRRPAKTAPSAVDEAFRVPAAHLRDALIKVRMELDDGTRKAAIANAVSRRSVGKALRASRRTSSRSER